jgi:hypothetical protein
VCIVAKWCVGIVNPFLLNHHILHRSLSDSKLESDSASHFFSYRTPVSGSGIVILLAMKAFYGCESRLVADRSMEGLINIILITIAEDPSENY